jgi:hypothetical protein
MAKSEVVDLGRTQVTVRELTLEEIKELFDATEKSATDGIVNMLEKATTIKRADLMKMAPSDMEPMLDKLVEVNSSFRSMSPGEQPRTSGKSGNASQPGFIDCVFSVIAHGHGQRAWKYSYSDFLIALRNLPHG